MLSVRLETISFVVDQDAAQCQQPLDEMLRASSGASRSTMGVNRLAICSRTSVNCCTPFVGEVEQRLPPIVRDRASARTHPRATSD